MTRKPASKTLYDHPRKPWPSMVACDPETMGSILEGFQHDAQGNREQLHA